MSPADPRRLSTTGLLVYVLVDYFGLFVAVGVGWLVWRAGDAVLGYDGGPVLEGLALLVGPALMLAGICLALAGLVGTAHKLLGETRST